MIAVITLAKPDKLNAVSAQSIDEIEAAFDELDGDDRIRAVIM